MPNLDPVVLVVAVVITFVLSQPLSQEGGGYQGMRYWRGINAVPCLRFTVTNFHISLKTMTMDIKIKMTRNWNHIRLEENNNFYVIDIILQKNLLYTLIHTTRWIIKMFGR